MHIPRSGGTTLRRVAQRQYEPSRIVHLYGSSVPDRIDWFSHLPRRTRSRCGLVIGHFTYGIHRDAAPPWTYIALAREPAARIASDYRFILANEDHVDHPAVVADRLSLLDFASSPRFDQATDNGLVRAFSGYGSVPRGALDERHLAAARANIERHFAVVGLTERFDESLVLLGRTLGWTRLEATRENAGRPAPGPQSWTPEILDRIRRDNPLDAELFRFVSERFAEQVAAGGVELAGEAAALRARRDLVARAVAEARALIAAHRFRDAIDLLEDAGRQVQGIAFFEHLKSVAHFHLGAIDGAGAAAARALHLDPFEREIALHAANLLATHGSLDKAAELLRFHLARQNLFDAEIRAELDRLLQARPAGMDALLATCDRLEV